MDFMEGKKTYVVVVMGLVSVVGAFLLGEVSLAQAITNALELLGLGALRLGVANK